MFKRVLANVLICFVLVGAVSSAKPSVVEAARVQSPTVVAPTVTVKKSVAVVLGKKIDISKIVSDPSAFEKMTLPNAKKYKKYLTVNKKTGTIKTKKYYKVKIKKPIPVKVKVKGHTYTVNVKIRIPAPNVKVKKKKVKIGGVKGFKYSFSYNIKKATKIQVRMKKGGSSAINREFDTYVSKPKSNKDSYIMYKASTLKKLKNKITFKIVAYYGKNKSETRVITK